MTIILFRYLTMLIALMSCLMPLKTRNTVSDMIKILDCPAMVEAMSYDCYSDYSLLSQSDLLIEQAWETEIGTIELWRGENDYLAILRKEDRVFVAQYVNNMKMEEGMGENQWKNNIYYHCMHSNVINETRLAYFIDGTGGMYYRIYSNGDYQFAVEEYSLLRLPELFQEDEELIQQFIS